MKWMLLACIALSGCATTDGYKKLLALYTGASEVELARSWGPPQSVYEAGGSRFLTYERGRSVFVQGQAPSYQSYNDGYGNTYTRPVGGTNSYTANYSCTTTFEVRNDRVIDARFRGNDCFAHAPKKVS